MEKQIKIKREISIEVDGGYVSEYTHFTCWVKNFEKGGEGLIVVKDDSGDMDDMLCYCAIAYVVDHNNPKYEELIAEKEQKLFYDYTAEFITDDNIYYVFLIENRTEALSKAFNLQVEDKISFNGYCDWC